MLWVAVGNIENSPKSGHKFNDYDYCATPFQCSSFRFSLGLPSEEEPVTRQENWSDKNEINYGKVPVPILIEENEKHIINFIKC